MKKAIKSLYFGALITITAFSVSVARLNAQINGVVISVSDGDTFTMLTANNKQVKVRLHGIDCPEKNQDYGHIAKQYTSKLVFGRHVHVAITDTDRYRRLVGKVFVNGETCLNEELLKAGMAWHYKKYDTSVYWNKLELRAKQQKKGLWAQGNAVEPRKFRRKNR